MENLPKSQQYTRQQIYLVALFVLLICLVALPPVATKIGSLTSPATTPTLRYAYSAPTVGAPGDVQFSQFDSFRGHANNIELYNTRKTKVTVTIDILDSTGAHLFDIKATLLPRGSKRIPLNVAPDTYGTMIINGRGVVFRNYVSSNKYVLPFLGE